MSICKGPNRSTQFLALLCLLTLLLTGCTSPQATVVAPQVPTSTAATRTYWPTEGWRTSPPEAQGIDSQKLAQLLAGVPGLKLLVVQPLNLDGSDRGEAILALDAVSAGVGDRVLLATEGWGAMTSVGRPNSPIDTSVIGIIDVIDLQEQK